MDFPTVVIPSHQATVTRAGVHFENIIRLYYSVRQNSANWSIQEDPDIHCNSGEASQLRQSAVWQFDDCVYSHSLTCTVVNTLLSTASMTSLVKAKHKKFRIWFKIFSNTRSSPLLSHSRTMFLMSQILLSGWMTLTLVHFCFDFIQSIF